jgi:putative two-component system response regulator
VKILVVDDELVSREKMKKLVQSIGHETVIANDGIEALEVWRHEGLRMVIADWKMPRMDGLNLCKEIRNSEGGTYTYFIMVTTKSNIKDVIVGMEGGADDFITKPFVKEDLIARIRAGERILSLETKDIVIFSMAKLAESRDPETGKHLERIRHYSKVLAEALAARNSFSEEIDKLFINNIYLSSPLHDIGKVGIPDSVLLKPARLDDKEFNIMKEHTNIGFKTLNEALTKYPQADYLRMSAEIALSHHEKFDGSGYPNGLRGNEIPLSAQIVAIADVYDALTNNRAYKIAFSHDVAKGIIIEERNTHFNPELIDAFLFKENKLIEINNKYVDALPVYARL